MALRVSRRRFTVEEFHRMADAQVFSEDDRVELLEGEIIEIAPIGSRHASCVDRLNQVFALALGEEAIVRVQNPLRLSQHSEPQPDLSVLRRRADFYAGAHPAAPDVFLVVEVAETSAEADREIKIPLYARSGVVEVWLIDLPEHRVEVFRDPSAQGYRDLSRLTPGDTARPRSLPVAIPVEQLLA